MDPARADRRSRRLRAVLPAALLLLAACSSDLPQNTLDPAGQPARRQADLFILVFWIAVGVFVLVQGLLIVAMIRFRRRPGREHVVQVHGNTRLEVLWTVIPALMLIGVGVPTVTTIFDLAKRPTGDVVEVRVIGHQWWWEFQYPDQNIVTANELHIPVNRPVHLTLTSQDMDSGLVAEPAIAVIHSFAVPKLAGTQDLVPGRENELTLEADEPGTYLGQCREFCGLSHANMRVRVVAQTEEEFQQWLLGQKAPAGTPAPGSIAEQGADVFDGGFAGFDGVQFNCMACHGIDPSQPVPPFAPNLAHFASRGTFAAGLFELNEENLRRWLRDPGKMKFGAKMPNYHLTDDDIEALVAYLMSLK